MATPRPHLIDPRATAPLLHAEIGALERRVQDLTRQVQALEDAFNAQWHRRLWAWCRSRMRRISRA